MKWLRRGYRALMMTIGALCLGFWMYQLYLKVISGDIAEKLGFILKMFS